MKLVRALYGLKISGGSWWGNFKYHIVNFLGFTPSTIDHKMYYQCNTKGGGTDYYELLLVDVDELLTCSYYAKAFMA